MTELTGRKPRASRQRALGAVEPDEVIPAEAPSRVIVPLEAAQFTPAEFDGWTEADLVRWAHGLDGPISELKNRVGLWLWKLRDVAVEAVYTEESRRMADLLEVDLGTLRRWRMKAQQRHELPDPAGAVARVEGRTRALRAGAREPEQSAAPPPSPSPTVAGQSSAGPGASSPGEQPPANGVQALPSPPPPDPSTAPGPAGVVLFLQLLATDSRAVGAALSLEEGGERSKELTAWHAGLDAGITGVTSYAPKPKPKPKPKPEPKAKQAPSSKGPSVSDCAHPVGMRIGGVCTICGGSVK